MSEAQHHPTTDRRFSQDIIELIFEEAQLDDFRKMTLFACSRVSNEWRRIALKYVFRTLSLIVQSNEEIRFPIHINRFMTDFLAAPESSYLAPLVRKLTITWGTLAGNPIQYDFIDYLPSFPSLHTLSLVGGVAQRITETARPYVGTLCLDNLWIEGQPSNFHDLVALCDLLSLFRSLNCLRLDRVKTLRRTIDRAGWQQIPLPKISSLALRNMDALDRDCVLSKLLGPRSVLSTLKSLDVTATTLLAAGFKTLGRHASSVEHLALEVQIPSSRPSDLQRGTWYKLFYLQVFSSSVRSNWPRGDVVIYIVTLTRNDRMFGMPRQLTIPRRRNDIRTPFVGPTNIHRPSLVWRLLRY